MIEQMFDYGDEAFESGKGGFQAKNQEDRCEWESVRRRWHES